MHLKVVFAALLSLANTRVTHSAHIVIFTPCTTKSEMNLFFPFSESLAKKGHEVTVFAPVPMKNIPKGVTWLVSEEFMKAELMEEFGQNAIASKSHWMDPEWGIMISMMGEQGSAMSDLIMLQAKQVKELVESGKKVDLMIINGGLHDFALPLVHIFKCPFLYMSGSGMYPWLLHSVGAPLSTAYSPSILSGYGDRMTIWQRASNTLKVLGWNYLKDHIIIPDLEKKLKPLYIKDDTPPLKDIDRNVSLILSCRDVSLEYPRSYPPNVISIGCVHCQDPKPLPKDLADFVDSSGEDGFIYFSFGTVVKFQKSGEFIRENFFKAFAQLPQRFLVKWDKPVTNEEVGAPPNVKLVDWLPQQDILGHPRIKAFISHGGLFSTMETLYHGVPVLSFPFFWDQEYNAGVANQFGFGIKMDIATVTSSKVLDALRRLTTDPSFQQNMKYRSKIFRDQPDPPMERAIFWTEFALRHQGAPHLRPVSRQLPSYQLYLLDVMLVFALVAFVILGLLYFLIRSFVCILSMLFKRKSKKE